MQGYVYRYWNYGDGYYTFFTNVRENYIGSIQTNVLVPFKEKPQEHPGYDIVYITEYQYKIIVDAIKKRYIMREAYFYDDYVAPSKEYMEEILNYLPDDEYHDVMNTCGHIINEDFMRKYPAYQEEMCWKRMEKALATYV